jgi:hypothetical protein
VQASTSEVLIDHLPGFPDNLNFDTGSGTFWVGLLARASPLMTSKLLFPQKWVRSLVAWLPEEIIDWAAPPLAGAVQFDGKGDVLKVVADPLGKVAFSTPSAVAAEGGNIVVMGNLKNDYLTLVLLNT